ncbi:TraX family protein [Candidatus Avoscillospira sp. LCP25S3_F1]|uniref:TraX family protein n=1 Tax=Candidatus Avoscillospira sp. LCP25S3_F1 TaxID=3438825 RepID=UPI003F93AD4F
MIHESTSLSPRIPGNGITLNSLKYIAILAMTIDHIAFAFVPDGTPLAIVMHIVGRITGPVMFFSAVEGYHHTKNIGKYMMRLAVFALVSWFPFLYFKYGNSVWEHSWMRPNVIYTILLGVLAIHIRRSSLIKCPVIKTLLILALIILCVPADWGCTGILIILVLDFFYGNFQHQAFAYCVVVLLHMEILTMLTTPFFGLFYDHVFYIDAEYYLLSIANVGAFLPILLLSFYRGRHGAKNGFTKWFFYSFYPIHLLILGLLQTL